MLPKNKIKLSIVIPVFDEERYLERLFLDIKKYFNDETVEIIFVDDGSNDNSNKILQNLKEQKNYFFNFIIINFEKNTGKGNAVKKGMNVSNGEYILLQDADLELDISDSKELYDTINKDKNIKCIFGSRYLSGKLKKHNYFINQFIGKLNTLIFNLFFGQSLTDIHCGLKILRREVYNKINLSINDFGLEIDIASQVIKNNFFIYEMGVSYFSRTKKEGKKITWFDGIKSYYYLFKVRFLDNSTSTKFSIVTSCLYMGYVGSYFGMGLGNTLFIITFFLIGLIIGLKTKVLSSLSIFLFIYIGSFFGKGQGQVLSVLVFFILGLFLTNKLRKKINNRFKTIKILF